MEELLARQAVDVGDQDVDDVLVVFKPPFEISGTVRLEGNPPQNKGSIRVNLMATETIGGGSRLLSTRTGTSR